MTTANGYDPDVDIAEYDGMGDMGEDREFPVQTLMGDAFSLGAPGANGKHDDNTFSAVIAKQQELRMDGLWGFLRDHKPDSHQGRVVMQQTASAIIYTITSGAMQIKRRQDTLRDAEKELRKTLSRTELDEVAVYYDRWSKGNSMQQYLVSIALKHGWRELERREPPYEEDDDGNPLPVTTGPRWEWHNADREMREAEREAILDLPRKSYDYFFNLQQTAVLQREQNENRARDLPDIDVSDWLAKIKKGDADIAEVILGGSWLIQELVTFGLAHEGENNPYWNNLIKLFRGVREQAVRRNNWFRRRQSMADEEGG